MGWRYLLFTLGGVTLLLWAIRLFLFQLLESPRYLVGLGKDAEAIAVIHHLAAYNSTTTDISVEILAKAGQNAQSSDTEKRRILSQSSKFTLKHIKALFATPKMAWSTSLLIALWGAFSLLHCQYMTIVDSNAQA